MTKLVEKENILKTRVTVSADGKNTYAISKAVEGLDGGKGVLVMLYPTRTVDNFYVEDSTNVHLMNHMKSLGINEYVVVNLFSIVTQSRLSVKGLKLDEENLKYIRDNIFKTIDNSKDKVIIAWGNSHQTSKVVNQAKLEILKMWTELHKTAKLYQMTADGLDKDNIGVHPLYLGIRYANATWKLAPYPHAKVLKELIEEGRKTPEQKAPSLKVVKSPKSEE
ncbi:DUF1643 domain-containing protein [Clostridium transplantifaecale]|uniref:DUF1643 domain-containing protein n=1 Tax=Clostridium transplantifaecale TaxID=2479838 RepID=UPI0013DE1971|nr:DUF1643 domain-containing protein [Clostridium transplantifaecale]